MGGLVSGSANRYESGSEEFKEEQQPVVAGVNGLFGRRRNSRKLSVRNLDTRQEIEHVRIDHLAVPCASRHPFSDYRFNKKLGSGAFSTVYKCTSVFNESITVAIKEVRTQDLTKDQLLDLQTEMNILSQVHHKNIVNLNAVFVVPDKIFMVMEYLRGGELLKAICKRTCYEERDAKRIMIQIADAVRYLHFRGVIHRDLKPENIILETKDFQSGIKIVDFGFAIATDDIQPRTKKYVKGTPGYMAPEVITSGEYSTGCDIWSLGVILYIILSGTMPFDARNKESVVEGKYHYPSRVWSTVSMDARDLIDKMIVKKCENRISAAEVLRHPWITSYYDDPLSGTIAANFASGSTAATDNSGVMAGNNTPTQVSVYVGAGGGGGGGSGAHTPQQFGGPSVGTMSRGGSFSNANASTAAHSPPADFNSSALRALFNNNNLPPLSNTPPLTAMGTAGTPPASTPTVVTLSSMSMSPKQHSRKSSLTDPSFQTNHAMDLSLNNPNSSGRNSPGLTQQQQQQLGAMSPSNLIDAATVLAQQQQARQYRSPSLLHPIIEVARETELDKFMSNVSLVPGHGGGGSGGGTGRVSARASATSVLSDADNIHNNTNNDNTGDNANSQNNNNNYKLAFCDADGAVSVNGDGNGNVDTGVILASPRPVITARRRSFENIATIEVAIPPQPIMVPSPAQVSDSVNNSPGDSQQQTSPAHCSSPVLNSYNTTPSHKSHLSAVHTGPTSPRSPRNSIVSSPILISPKEGTYSTHAHSHFGEESKRDRSESIDTQSTSFASTPAGDSGLPLGVLGSVFASNGLTGGAPSPTAGLGMRDELRDSADSNDQPPALPGDLSGALRKMRNEFRILGHVAVGVGRFKQAGKLQDSKRRALSCDAGSIAVAAAFSGSNSPQMQTQQTQAQSNLSNLSNLIATQYTHNSNNNASDGSGNNNNIVRAHAQTVIGTIISNHQNNNTSSSRISSPNGNNNSALSRTSSGRSGGTRSYSVGSTGNAGNVGNVVTGVKIEEFLHQMKANDPHLNVKELLKDDQHDDDKNPSSLLKERDRDNGYKMTDN